MEGASVSQYADCETVTKDWSEEEIFNDLLGSGSAWGNESAFIAAAGLRDNSALLLLLQRAQLLDRDKRLYVIDQEHDRWTENTEQWPTPLLRAIERQRSKNVRLLLEYGANPNGISTQTQKVVARMSRRFQLTDKLRSVPYLFEEADTFEAQDVGTVPHEYIPHTADELTTRRTGITRFWTEPHKSGFDYSRDELLLNSVVRAGTSIPGILDQVLRGGADASAWLRPDIVDRLADEESLTPSALDRSTPLHAAIASENMAMLRTLLDRGFNPNARALITGSCALTPLQYAVIVGNLEAYLILEAHHQLDKSVVTPVFRVHVLHFATAHLRVGLIAATNVPLSSAPVTALGHTLLHIACLPYKASEVCTSKKIEQSIHDVRNLHNSQATGYPPASARYDSLGRKLEYDQLPREERPKIAFPKPRDMSDELRRQEAVCKLLIAGLGPGQIRLTDIHGNTALHYLAGSWFLNESLISWMRAQPEGEHVWHNAENMWGHTPQALWHENHQERAVATADPCGEGCMSGYCVRSGLGLGGRCTASRGDQAHQVVGYSER